MIIAPPAGYASNILLLLAALGCMCPNTLSPHSVPVVSSVTTGTTYSITSAPWHAIQSTSMTSMNPTSLPSSTSSNLVSQTPAVTNGYSKDFLHSTLSPKDLAALRQGTRRISNLIYPLPPRRFLIQRHCPEWYSSGLRSHRNNSPFLPVLLAPLVKDVGSLPHLPAVTH